MQFALDFFNNKSLVQFCLSPVFDFASLFSINVLDHDIYYWFRPPSHRAVYVILSLNVASIIYCFDESDHDKLRLEEANYREVECPMSQYESIFHLEKFPTKLNEFWNTFFENLNTGSDMDSFVIQDLIAACKRKIEIVTIQTQVLSIMTCAGPWNLTW